ncbi:hypothetical protein BGZ46_006146, partial [Entomortierella lignicola]
MLAECTKIYNNEKDRVSLPRGTMSIAITMLEEKHHLQKLKPYDIQRIQKDISKNFELYTELVERDFNKIWSSIQKEEEENIKVKETKSAEKQTKATAENTDGPSHDGGHEEYEDVDDDVNDKESIRTCTVPLSHILHPDLQAHYKDVVDIIKDCQTLVTDDIIELTVLANKAVLAIAAGELWESGPSVIRSFDLMKIFPDGFKVRCDMSPIVSVAPIPTGLQDSLEAAMDKGAHGADADELDIASLLSQAHLQYVHASLLGVRGSKEKSKTTHPIWEKS